MKKIIILLTVAMMSFGAYAQNYLGVKAGGGAAILSVGGSYDHVPGLMVSYGLSYKQQIFNRVVLEGNILMESREPVISPFEVINKVTYDFPLPSTWISVPLTIHWHMPFRQEKLVPYRIEETKSNWYVEGGPQLNYALSATTVLDPVALPEKPKDIAAGGFDVGIVGGIGANFAFKNNLNRLTLGARVYYGFLNYNHYDGAPTETMMTAGGYLCYDFKLSKKRYYQYRM